MGVPGCRVIPPIMVCRVVCPPPQSFLYLTWYMAMSLLGHYNNFFFASHLLDIAMGVKTLRTILSSVTHNGKQVWGGGCVGLGGVARAGMGDPTDTILPVRVCVPPSWR